MSPRASEAQPRLRKLNLMLLLPPVALSGVLTVVIDSDHWWEAAVLAVGVVAALVAFVSWTKGLLLRVAAPCLIVNAAVWLFGSLVADSATAIFGLIVTGPLVVPRLPRYRVAAAIGLTGYVAVAGASRLLTPYDHLFGVIVPFIVIPTGLTVMIIGLMFPNKRFYDVVEELEEARDREAELAVARERVRFAGDLHDIQGHTLHVVKLKTALARKLVHSDPSRAEAELREIHDLVADTITQTKELAHAQRRLNLVAEVENAKNLFEAAGIRVHIERESEADPHVSELLGQILRETTTNILRHAQSTTVWVTVASAGISIVNDGVRDAPPPVLRGLATLKNRVAAEGGELTARQRDGRFETTADFPRAAIRED